MKNPQVQTLKDTIESLHNLTVWYLIQLKETDVYKNFEFNGNKINSLYWLTAHIAHTEDSLIAEALYKKPHQYQWLKDFDYGSSIETTSKVSYSELVEIAKEIHIKCMKILDELTDEELEKDNALDFKIGDSKSIKSILIHHIRHLGVHTGHLSMLCKLNGIKTF